MRKFRSVSPSTAAPVEDWEKAVKTAERVVLQRRKQRDQQRAARRQSSAGNETASSQR